MTLSDQNRKVVFKSLMVVMAVAPFGFLAMGLSGRHLYRWAYKNDSTSTTPTSESLLEPTAP